MSSGVRETPALKRIWEEKRRRQELREGGEEVHHDALAIPAKTYGGKKIDSGPDAKKRREHELYTSGAVSSSFTSSKVIVATQNTKREMTEEEERDVIYAKVSYDANLMLYLRRLSNPKVLRWC